MNTTLTEAIRTKNLDLVKKAHAGGCAFRVWTMEDAIRIGTFEIMEWLYENGCQWSKGCFRYAIIRIQRKKDAYINKCFDNLITCNPIANIKKHIDARVYRDVYSVEFKILDWLLKNKCPFGRAYDTAVGYSDIVLMNWLFKHSCPLDIGVFSTALKYNVSQEAIFWLCEKQCPQVKPESNIIPSRRSERIKKRPNYLNDYVC